MPWILTCFLFSTIALIASALAILGALRASAATANLHGLLSSLEKSERLTPSRLAELADVRDAIEKANALLKRVNSREAMRARNQKNLDVELVPDDPAALKAYLRRKAGLVAGKPAAHE